MKIVADDKIPFLKGVLEPFVQEVKYLPGADISKADVADADALIVRTRTGCNAQLLEGAAVKMVVTATIGTDHFDIPWLEKAGIEWRNAPGCNSGSVRQYIGSVLSLLIDQGLDLRKATIGVVGVGMVGSKVAQIAGALGMRVLLNDPPRQRREGSTEFASLDTVLKESDIVTFHTPLETEGEDATFHLFNNKSLKILKPGAIIINSSRGEVTCTKALLKGLSSGVVSKAVLDVWENEPNISGELLDKAWLATPHIAGYSADGKANGTSMSVQAISRRFNLGLDNWEPQSVPEPSNTLITIDCRGLHPCQVAAKAMLQTYNVLDDDARLRANPHQFEKQRGDYPLRREFYIWKVKLINSTTEISEMIKSIGFKLNS